MATAALVCGIVALVAGVVPFLFFIAVPVGLAALVTGVIGLRRAGAAQRGRGMAVGGLVTGALGLVVVGVWAAVLLGSDDVREDLAEGFREGLATGDGWSDLQPGDCFESLGAEAEIRTVPTVPCDQPHVYEAFGVLEHPAPGKAEFPGFDPLIAHGLAECEQEPFSSYVGTGYLESRFLVDTLVPDAVSWRFGERRIICLLFAPEQETVTGSARGSGQ